MKQVVNNYDINFESINAGEYIFKHLLFSAVTGLPMSENLILASTRLLMRRIINIAKHFQYFTDLPSRLQELLLKHNVYMAAGLRATCFQSHKVVCQIMYVLGKEEREAGEEMIQKVLKSEVASRKDFTLRHAQHFTTLQKYMSPQDVERIQLLAPKINSKLAYDKNIVVLLSHVVLFCTDFHNEYISSADKKLIEKTQEKLVLMVQRYLYSTYPQGMARIGFSKVMETLIELREASTIKMHADEKLRIKSEVSATTFIEN